MSLKCQSTPILHIPFDIYLKALMCICEVIFKSEQVKALFLLSWLFVFFDIRKATCQPHVSVRLRLHHLF